MLRAASELVGYTLAATDGDLGRCKDFLIDDRQWAVRYMVADTRKWLSGRKVVISPIALGEPDWESRRFPIDLTIAQIKGAPPLEEHEPVSQQYELEYNTYFGWPDYWSGSGAWGTVPVPIHVRTQRQPAQAERANRYPNHHLRSLNEINGYRIQAEDKEIGQAHELIIDDHSWEVRYLVIETRRWLLGRRVLIAPKWIDTVDWAGHAIQVDLTAEQIKNSPEYDPSKPVNRAYEVMLYDYYGRPDYWTRVD